MNVRRLEKTILMSSDEIDESYDIDCMAEKINEIIDFINTIESND